MNMNKINKYILNSIIIAIEDRLKFFLISE